MRSILGILITPLLAIQLTGCALLGKNSSKKGGEFTPSVLSKEGAPAWMSPPADMSRLPASDPVQKQSQADFHFTLAETYSLAGEVKKAIEEYRLALVYDPNSAEIHTRLAREYLHGGMLNEAIESAELAVKMNEKGVDQRLLLGKLFSSLKLYDKALVQYSKALELDPTQFDASLYIGAILAEKGESEAAVKHFKDLAKSKDFERAHLAYYYIGKIEQKGLTKKGLKKAERAFEKSLKADPEFEDSLIALARIYIHDDNKKKATKVLSNFQTKHGPSEKVARFLVNLYMEKEEFGKAFDQFEVLEARNPSDLNVKMKMALILMDRKDYGKATRYLKGILARDPTLDKVRFYLAAVYEETKKYPEAIVHFSKIPPSSQYYPDSVVHSSYLYKIQGGMDKALAAIKDGIKHRSDVAEFYTLYASLLDETQKYSKAVAMLEEAIERFPKNTELLFYLGSMYDKVGNSEKTISQMKLVLDLDGNHVQALNYLAYTYAEKNIHLESAENLARKALTLTPKDGYVMDTLGWILFKKGNLQEAVLVLEQAFRLKSTESIIAEHLGDAYYKYQLPQKARRMYMQAVGMESNAGTIRKLQNKIKAIDQQTSTRSPASE